METSIKVQSGYVPTGSYMLTCKDTRVVLSCLAQKRDHSWIQATFDLTNAANADLANIDGVLKNQGNASHSGYVPAGSYRFTCTDIKVTLTCQAQKKDQSWIPATFDLTSAVLLDLANMDGVLKNQGPSIPVSYVPEGSYKLTCRNISVILTCLAQKKDQSWIGASFDLTSSTVVNLDNMDGVLKNNGKASPIGYLPDGSYKKSCKDYSVTLTCQAQKRDQSWVPATFDLTNVSIVNLDNIDGVLKLK